jgi:hypothetical protein
LGALAPAGFREVDGEDRRLSFEKVMPLVNPLQGVIVSLTFHFGNVHDGKHVNATCRVIWCFAQRQHRHPICYDFGDMGLVSKHYSMLKAVRISHRNGVVEAIKDGKWWFDLDAGHS